MIADCAQNQPAAIAVLSFDSGAGFVVGVITTDKKVQVVQSKLNARSAAPGPYLGYALQPVRLCYHLFSADPGGAVSIEHLDDVAVHTSGGIVLEQTKSATAQNPVSDWSPELWKTFANWIDTIESGQIDLESSQFRLYVTPPRSGGLVQLLSDATSDDAVDQAITRIREELDSLPKRPVAHKFLKKLLEFDAAKRRTLIRHFKFDSVDDDPVDALRKLVRVSVSAAMVDTCCEYAIGHAKEHADSLLRAGSKPIIDVEQFRKAFIAFVHKNDLNSLLVSIAPPPPDEIVAQTLADSPVFVRQLQIVDLAPEHQLRAVSDFLQSSVNKTKWAADGLIVRESLEEFDEDLLQGYGLIRLEIQDTHSSMDPKAQGRILYARCANSKAKLEGREVPGHFVPGCYHDLANSLKLGWHPDFGSLLGVKED
jgi:hypothetical protein